MRSRSDQRSNTRQRSRAGFTLLEVLLTSLLASVVLVALWSLSDIYLKLFVSGQKMIEETQLARGLTQQFAKDISQVNQLVEESPPLFPGPPLRAENGLPAVGRVLPPAVGMVRPNSEEMPLPTRNPGGLPGTVESGRPRTTSSDSSGRTSDQSAPKFGLFGTKQALRLIVLQTDPRTAREPTDLAEVLLQPGQPRPPVASELRTVEYTFSRSAESSSSEYQRPSGLIRREWAWETWIGLRLANLRSGTTGGAADMLPESDSEWTAEDALALQLDQGVLHVPQVTGLEFRYFDGESWESEWNSWEQRKLPLLVEVLLQINATKGQARLDDDEDLGDEAGESLAAASGSSGSSLKTGSQGTVYRRLIHLPFAEEPPSPDASGRANPVADVARISPERGTRQP